MADMAGLPEADIVVVATVGDAGFRPTESALRAGNDVALASKEMLVMVGGLFRTLADASDAAILPIDSEHSAIWQCLAGEAPEKRSPTHSHGLRGAVSHVGIARHSNRHGQGSA